ncbi:hypothetical protein Pmani_039778 [Petrolisthes manimaculis]|uniref:Uncharacterized protein n=1 Tax=Petrolisthes manimaculis TaxID=1843537 RepID=A0AAE1NC42_9EUCA|nr:hypothetical protein Pmani_039778 [Petrolisthes manimaculis]
MDDCMWPSLNYQVMFVRKTSPWERSEWDDEELSDFTLELEEVDRLYYIHENQSSDDNDYFHILARVCRGGGGETKKEEKKKEKKESHQYLFVELSASCDNTGFEVSRLGRHFRDQKCQYFLPSDPEGRLLRRQQRCYT